MDVQKPRSTSIAAVFTATTLTLATLGVAQEQGDPKPVEQTTKNLFDFNQFRGATIREQGAGNGNATIGGATDATTDRQRSLGTVVDVVVASPRGDTTYRGEGAGATRPRGVSGSAKAIVNLTATGGSGVADASGQRGGTDATRGNNFAKHIVLPLGDLHWNENGRYFTCSKTAAQLQAMPAWKDHAMMGRTDERRTGEQQRDRDRDGTNRDEQGKDDVTRNEQRREGRFAGDGDSIKASWISRAALRSKDDHRAQVAAVVFDLQKGSLEYLLATPGAGTTGGAEDETQRSGGTSRMGEACVIPWSVVEVKQAGAAGEREDVEKQQDRTRPAMGLELCVPITSQKLKEAPKVKTGDLGKLEQSGTAEKIREFYAKAN